MLGVGDGVGGILEADLLIELLFVDIAITDTNRVPLKFSNPDTVSFEFVCVCAYDDRKHILDGTLACFFLFLPVILIHLLMEKDVLMDPGRMMTVLTGIMNATRKIL